MLIFELQHVRRGKRARVKLLKVTAPLPPQALDLAVNAVAEIEDSSGVAAPGGAGAGRLAPWQEQKAKELIRASMRAVGTTPAAWRRSRRS